MGGKNERLSLYDLARKHEWFTWACSRQYVDVLSMAGEYPEEFTLVNWAFIVKVFSDERDIDKIVDILSNEWVNADKCRKESN